MRKHTWFIVVLCAGLRCEFDQSRLDLPPRPDDGEAEAEAESESEAESEGDERGGCESTLDACTCGIAPAGCFCGPGCSETGNCCPDAVSCGVDPDLGLLTAGCGDGACSADETCAICPQDCGICALGVCPPPPLIISYEIGDSRPAMEIWAEVRFITKQGISEWQWVGVTVDDFRLAFAIPVPSDALAVDVWVNYVQANGRGRASCEGVESFIPAGDLRVTRIGILLVGSLVLGGAGEPGNCSHRYAVK